jgi:hypothetical protein
VITGIATGFAVVIDDSFNAGLDERTVEWRLAHEGLPVNDEAVGLLGEVEAIAELGFCIGLSSYEDVDV